MDFQKAVELINKSNSILLTTHTRPDGDACGCIVALAETLKALGKNAKMLLLSELPQWYEFLFEQKSASGRNLARLDSPRRGRAKGGPEIFSPGTAGVPWPDGERTKIDADLIIIADTNTYNQLPDFDKYLKQSGKPILVIDHHTAPESSIEDKIGGDVSLIDPSGAAAAMIVFDLLKYAGWPITKKIAEALFVAISTDTGWFQFDNTDSRALKVCAELIDAGATPSQMYRDLYQNFSPQRFKLMVAMLNSLELHLDGRLAIQHITQQDFKRTGAKFSDTENLIDECRRISSVEAAALLVEQADGQIKVSLRSMGAIDVCEIAAKFGGGGHKMAAGAHLPGPMEKAKQLIHQQVKQKFDEMKKG
ncbi:MAG: bifunctional oligoribonuclease/PAP phosphatase NrnA [Sedimentisphaerales bacterium]|nr:bifunctional oligoribonuclease/PAP phosphatase NrnA [Sedimentisphaerales bacterium]